mmetsp:Transcript_24221/g.37321  ORF Transcript_24221/g.37321 Transcript_24221/m.37321 type:complete len:108 (+) Transcript_24221:1340-1663(+)
MMLLCEILQHPDFFCKPAEDKVRFVKDELTSFIKAVKAFKQVVLNSSWKVKNKAVMKAEVAHLLKKNPLAQKPIEECGRAAEVFSKVEKALADRQQQIDQVRMLRES